MLALPGDIDGQERARVDPATNGHTAVTSIEAEHHAPRQGFGHRREKIGLLDGDAPHDEPRDPRIGIGAGRVERPDPSSELAGDPGRPHHPRDEVGLQRSSRLGTVEIDDVEPSRPLIDESLHLLDRVFGKHRLPVVVPLEQPNAASSTEVDRGPQFHGGSSGGRGADDERRLGKTDQDRSTKARRRRMPASWLFSGWNCVANNRPRATAAQNSPP